METHITAVTVFPDRARVTRSARLDLEPGLHKVEIQDLPLALIADSVRAAGRGTARARLLGVSVRLEHYVDTPAEAVRDLEARLLAAQDAGAELAGRASVLEKERANLEDLGAQAETFARGLALRNQKPDEQGAIFDFLRARKLSLQSDLNRIAQEVRENDKRIDQLRRQLQAAQAARPRQRHTAVVELDVAAAGDLTLELVYVVLGAHWEPVYDIRLSGAALEVSYLAQVRQNTGEDWRDVALMLSTAQPALSLSIPELDPWYLRPAPPPIQAFAKRAVVPLPAAAPARAAPVEQLAVSGGAMPQAEPELLADLEAESAAVSEAGPSLTYQLAGRADIPGNNEPRKVTVAAFPLKPELDYVTAPRLQAACYRRATVRNESAYTLLPGAAQLFEGDDYLGATRLAFTAPGQEVELFLGADERLRVERELAGRDVDKSLIGDRRRIHYAYTIEAENLRDAPQSLLVRDQLPVARDEQIKVRLDNCDPKPAEHDEMNRMEWKLTLKASAKTTIRFEFTVEFPRAWDVQGLP
jgi:uncharacterized protein (TIGR02231 family)